MLTRMPSACYHAVKHSNKRHLDWHFARGLCEVMRSVLPVYGVVNSMFLPKSTQCVWSSIPDKEPHVHLLMHGQHEENGSIKHWSDPQSMKQKKINNAAITGQHKGVYAKKKANKTTKL
jgi:hypothetical protein